MPLFLSFFAQLIFCTYFLIVLTWIIKALDFPRDYLQHHPILGKLAEKRKERTRRYISFSPTLITANLFLCLSDLYQPTYIYTWTDDFKNRRINFVNLRCNRFITRTKASCNNVIDWSKVDRIINPISNCNWRVCSSQEISPYKCVWLVISERLFSIKLLDSNFTIL